MASAEREAITGVFGGGAPSGIQGQSPWSGTQGAKPPEAESILSFTSANGAQICQFLLPCKLLKYAFWATVCKTVRPMLLDRCLSVLSLVYCGQTVGWISMPLGKLVWR